MMQIDRSNYEIWFIDWLDSNLNSLQVEQLKLFLDQNPDLREEFNDLTSLKLVSSAVSFRHKEYLKKSPPDISEDQFEYLCAAYLENDLSESQKAELQEIVNIYPDRKRNFDLIQKTIIEPAGISYKHKNRLLRRTALQNFIRISAFGLSAAAAISIIIIIYPVIPGASTKKQINTAHNFMPDSTIQRPSQVMAKEKIIIDSVPLPAEKKGDIMTTRTQEARNGIVSDDTITSPSDYFQARSINNPGIPINKIPVNPQIDLNKDESGNTLIASSQIIYVPDTEDERSRVGKFISKTFREKILKEKTPHDAPLKGFEIAEAGVAGLNKLFGWQMALDIKNDDNGQPKSVYFSSKILKVNAPVKKREAQP
jgi:hypothetical protein